MKEKNKNEYRTYHIREMMYYGEELEYFTVIMIDDTIFRFDSIDEFIKWYKEMDVKNNAKRNRCNDKRI